MTKTRTTKNNASPAGCSFCLSPPDVRLAYIAGPQNVAICSKCAFLALEILNTEFDHSMVRRPPNTQPQTKAQPAELKHLPKAYAPTDAMAQEAAMALVMHRAAIVLTCADALKPWPMNDLPRGIYETTEFRALIDAVNSLIEAEAYANSLEAQTRKAETT